jgi:virginiamycin B lyase
MIEQVLSGFHATHRGLAVAALVMFQLPASLGPLHTPTAPNAASSGAIRVFRTGLSRNSFYPGPGGITAGPDGNIWFTESHRIGRITPNGRISEYHAGLGPKSEPTAITAGSDGNIWFTDEGNNGDHAIGRITPRGQIKEFFNTPGGQTITTGSDGNLWINIENGITRMPPRGPLIGQFTTFTGSLDPNNSRLQDITEGPDHNVWFTDDRSTSLMAAGRIGRITPDGQITEFGAGLQPDTRPRKITVGPDGNLWFTELRGDGGGIGMVTPNGQITELSTPSVSPDPSFFPDSITAARDGNLWYTESHGIGRLTPTGQITGFAPSAGIQLGNIIPGPDGNLWFTEELDQHGNGAIARVTVAPR